MKTLAELQEHVRKGSMIAGKFAKTSDDLTRLAVLNWPMDFLIEIKSLSLRERRELVQGRLKHKLPGAYGAEQEYGFAWSLVLAMVLKVVISLIIDWYFSDVGNAAVIKNMATEAEHTTRLLRIRLGS